MENEKTSRPGEIAWVDLTVPNADEIRDFYQQVAGCKATPVDMGGYSDYQMTKPLPVPALRESVTSAESMHIFPHTG